MRFWCLSFLLDQLIILLLQSCVEGKGIELSCCLSFYSRHISVSTIKNYQITKPDCPKAGVIFSTNRNRRVCVDANLSLVQRAMKKIDLRKMEIYTNHPHHGTELQTQSTAGTLNPEPAADLHQNETDTQGRQKPNTTSPGSSESETEAQEPKTFRPKLTKDLNGSETEAQEPKTFRPETTKDLHESETEAQEPKTFRPETTKDLNGSETEAQEPKTFRPVMTKDLNGSETEAQEPKTFRPETTKDLHESETEAQEPKTFRPETTKDLNGSETEAQEPKTFSPGSSKDLHGSETHEDQTHTELKTPRHDLTQSSWFCQV